jgi:hypothetical protein
MLFTNWLFRLIRDVLHNSVANRAYAFGFSVFALLFFGLLIFGAQVYRRRLFIRCFEGKVADRTHRPDLGRLRGGVSSISASHTEEFNDHP